MYVPETIAPKRGLHRPPVDIITANGTGLPAVAPVFDDVGGRPLYTGIQARDVLRTKLNLEESASDESGFQGIARSEHLPLKSMRSWETRRSSLVPDRNTSCREPGRHRGRDVPSRPVLPSFSAARVTLIVREPTSFSC